MKMLKFFPNRGFLKKGVYIAFLDIIYYIVLGGILYLSFQSLDKAFESLNYSALGFGELGLIDNLAENSPQNITVFRVAEAGFHSAINQIILTILIMLITISFACSALKGAGYCILRKNILTLRYFVRGFLFNLVWRGIFTGFFILGFVIIKPESMFATWIILLALFFYFTPFIFMNLSTERSIGYIVANGFKASLKKAPIMLGGYILLILAGFLMLRLTSLLPGGLIYITYPMILLILVSFFKALFYPWIVYIPSRNNAVE